MITPIVEGLRRGLLARARQRGETPRELLVERLAEEQPPPDRAVYRLDERVAQLGVGRMSGEDFSQRVLARLQHRGPERFRRPRVGLRLDEQRAQRAPDRLQRRELRFQERCEIADADRRSRGRSTL